MIYVTAKTLTTKPYCTTYNSDTGGSRVVPRVPVSTLNARTLILVLEPNIS